MNDRQQPVNQPQRAAETRTAQAPTDFEQLLKKEVKVMEFVPFGAQDRIKLTVKIIQDLIAVPTRSGKTCSERDALKFMMMCQAKRLNPFEGDAFLIGYDGNAGPQFSLITAHQAFLKRAEVHPEFDGMKSGLIILGDDGLTITEREGDFHLPGEDIVGGWASVFFKNRKVPTTRKIRMSRFNNGFAQWKADPAGMICKCAEADALRSSFPTMVGGLYLREEMDFIPDVAVMKRPVFEPSALKNPESQPVNWKEEPSKMAEKMGVKDPEPEPPETESEQFNPNDGDLQPLPKTVPLPVGNGQPNYLKGVRQLCGAGKIKEGELLTYLANNDYTDGSYGSLEDLMLDKPEIMKSVFEQWSGDRGISTHILAARKGAK